MNSGLSRRAAQYSTPSDPELIAIFRAGNDDAFRVIHDRYGPRLLAYARRMLTDREYAEDITQEVLVRAYFGLRASERQIALKAWLFRVTHNRCIDELRRPSAQGQGLHWPDSTPQDPIAQADLRQSLQSVFDDVARLPERQRHALLMRELEGLTYVQIAETLGLSVAAVKSLLVRARATLTSFAEARDTPCVRIEQLLLAARAPGARPSPTANRHMRDCASSRQFRRQLRGNRQQLFSPADSKRA